jgi:hypothetical protein
MGVKTNLAGATNTSNPGEHNFVLQEAITGYSDEAYTTAKKLSGTGIVGSNPNIDTSTETFIGQVRWFKPMDHVVNVASLTDSSEGDYATYSSDYLRYVKTVRTHGGKKINLQQVVTQQDGLAKIGRDFAETRAQDEHNAILAVLRGVALAELLNGCAAASGATGLGGQTFTNDPEDKKYGFYVDLGAEKLISLPGTTPAGVANAAYVGAQRAEGFLKAFGMAYKDYEPEWAYLVVSPEVKASLRSANLVDSDGVVEANVKFDTIFGGKFRLIQTRASQGFSGAEIDKIQTGAGTAELTDGSKTSFIVLPGALAMQQLAIPEPTEIERKAGAFKGGGTTAIWHRWGYVLAPVGYDWIGSDAAFPSNANYYDVVEGGTQKALASVGSGTLAATTGVWSRKTKSALSLGILPVFHA